MDALVPSTEPKVRLSEGKAKNYFELFRALVPSTESKVRLSEGKAKFWSSESKDMLAWSLLSREKIQPKVNIYFELFRVTNWATQKMKPRITFFPSLRL